MSYPPEMNNEEQFSNPNRFESDIKKLVRLHLQNKNHVITDDELRNLRVGMTPIHRNPAGTERNEAQHGSASGHPAM